MNPEIRILQERLGQLEADCRQSRADCRRLAARLRVLGGLGVASLMVALFASPANRAAAQSGYGATLQALIDKTQYITVAGGEMYIRGTNLHIENGLGATNGDPSNPYTPFVSITNGKGSSREVRANASIAQ